MPEYTVDEIAAAVNGEVVGDGGAVIRGVNGIKEAGPDDVTFVANPKYKAALKETRAGAVIVAPKTEAAGLTLIKAANPYAAFARIVVMFAPPTEAPEGISELAYIHEKARIGEGVAVGPFVTVWEDAVVGDRTTLGAGTYVGSASAVGADCLIYPNVTIREGYARRPLYNTFRDGPRLGRFRLRDRRESPPQDPANRRRRNRGRRRNRRQLHRRPGDDGRDADRPRFQAG